MRQIAYKNQYLKIWNRVSGRIFTTRTSASPAFAMVRVSGTNYDRQFGMNT